MSLWGKLVQREICELNSTAPAIGSGTFQRWDITTPNLTHFSVCEIRVGGTVSEDGCHGNQERQNSQPNGYYKGPFPLAHRKTKEENTFGEIPSVLQLVRERVARQPYVVVTDMTEMDGQLPSLICAFGDFPPNNNTQFIMVIILKR